MPALIFSRFIQGSWRTIILLKRPSSRFFVQRMIFVNYDMSFVLFISSTSSRNDCLLAYLIAFLYALQILLVFSLFRISILNWCRFLLSPFQLLFSCEKNCIFTVGISTIMGWYHYIIILKNRARPTSNNQNRMHFDWNPWYCPNGKDKDFPGNL